MAFHLVATRACDLDDIEPLKTSPLFPFDISKGGFIECTKKRQTPGILNRPKLHLMIEN